MNRIKVKKALASLGVKMKVVNGKLCVNKNDLKRACASSLDHVYDLAENSEEFGDVKGNPELKKVFEKHASLLEKLDDKSLGRLFEGDYHIGHEHRAFPREYVSEIRQFAREAGHVLGWEEYEEM